jgi:hypothetical protein
MKKIFLVLFSILFSVSASAQAEEMQVLGGAGFEAEISQEASDLLKEYPGCVEYSVAKGCTRLTKDYILKKYSQYRQQGQSVSAAKTAIERHVREKTQTTQRMRNAANNQNNKKQKVDFKQELGSKINSLKKYIGLKIDEIVVNETYIVGQYEKYRKLGYDESNSYKKTLKFFEGAATNPKNTWINKPKEQPTSKPPRPAGVKEDKISSVIQPSDGKPIKVVMENQGDEGDTGPGERMYISDNMIGAKEDFEIINKIKKEVLRTK